MVRRIARLLAPIAIIAVAVSVYLVVHGTVDNHNTVTQTKRRQRPQAPPPPAQAFPQAEVLRRQAGRHAERDRDANGRLAHGLGAVEPEHLAERAADRKAAEAAAVTRGVARVAAALICLVVAAIAVPAVALAAGPPKLGVTAAALYAPATGQMLDGVDANREHPIASTTKLMTALIVLQRVHDLNTVYTYPDYHQAASDSQIGLEPGDRMTVHDLLVAMMLPSADDAAEDLADNIGHGSIGRFVAMMNAEARKLGLKHTHYSTPIGLDTPGNYSSAADLVKLADVRPQPFQVLRAHGRSVQRGAEDRPSPLRDQPQHAGRDRAVDHRGQDGAHQRRRLRPGRLRAQGRHDTDQRRARNRLRGCAERQRDGADELRLRQLPYLDAAASPSGGRPSDGEGSPRAPRAGLRGARVHPGAGA